MNSLAAFVTGLALLALAADTALAQPEPEPPALDVPAIAQPSAACAPSKLFRTTIRNISPGLAASDRAAQPRVIWRKGASLMRSEDDVDPLRGDQRLVIVAEPDVWMINLADRTGRHTVDPGPELLVRAPIVPLGGGVPPTLLRLEYGCEREFLAEFAPEPERQTAWGAGRARLHRVTIGEHSVAILMDDRGDRPLMVSYLRQGRPLLVIRYDDYRHGLPDRPQLFRPDKSVRITEAAEAAPPAEPF